MVAPVLPEYRMHFIAVMDGLLHEDDGLRSAVWLHQPAEPGGFDLQLLLIADIDPLAASAFSRHRA